MRTRAHTWLAVGLLVACAGAGAQEGEKEGPVRISVRLQVPETNLDHTLSLREIRSRFDSRPRNGSAKLVGFTRLEFEVGTRVETGVETTAAGEKSQWVEGVEVSLGYKTVDVFLPSDYAEGSCWYNAVLEHEQEHVARDRKLLEEYAERLEGALKKVEWPTPARPLRGLTEEEGKKRLDEALEKVLKPSLDELQKKRDRARDALDAQENGEALRRRCGG